MEDKAQVAMINIVAVLGTKCIAMEIMGKMWRRESGKSEAGAILNGEWRRNIIPSKDYLIAGGSMHENKQR